MLKLHFGCSSCSITVPSAWRGTVCNKLLKVIHWVHWVRGNAISLLNSNVCYCILMEKIWRSLGFLQQQLALCLHIDLKPLSLETFIFTFTSENTGLFYFYIIYALITFFSSLVKVFICHYHYDKYCISCTEKCYVLIEEVKNRFVRIANPSEYMIYE